MIVRRECDVPMARSKWLLPCDKDCINCMACIETTNTGERRHCTRHKRTNLELDMRIARAGIESEPWRGRDPEEDDPKRARKPWSDMETRRLRFLKEQGNTWEQIAEKLQRTQTSVRSRYQAVTKMDKEKTN